MNDKVSKKFMYCELVLRMERLEAKLDKLIELNQTKVVCNVSLHNNKDEEGVDSLLQTLKANLSSETYNDKPTRWPNESYTEYLTRIGQLAVAQSDEETFREECK